jgi:lipoprotein-releasing system permease protein
MLRNRNISLFLALRYIRPRGTFVSVITVISILGVSLGVAVLMVVIAVMAGFEQKIKDSVLGFEPHIEVGSYPAVGSEGKEGSLPAGLDWHAALGLVSAVEEVQGCFPYVDGLLFLDAGGDPYAAGVRAVRHEDRDNVAKLAGEMEAGEFDLSDRDLPEECDGRIVLGLQAAGQLGVQVGDVVTAYAPNNVGEIVRALREMDNQPEGQRGALMDEVESMVLPFQLQVAAIFRGDFHYDQIALLPLHIGQEVFETGGGISGIGVLTVDAYRAREVADRVQSQLPEGWFARTWMEKHAIWFATIRNERDMMMVALFMIVLVAAFSTMNTMITVTVQKRREIGVITALGSRVSQVLWIFLGQGMVVGIVGSLSGIGLGLLVIRFRNEVRRFFGEVFGREIFSEAIYGISEIPAKVLWSDIWTIAGGAFVLCSVAALIPAFMAARTDPAKALRGD